MLKRSNLMPQNYIKVKNNIKVKAMFFSHNHKENKLSLQIRPDQHKAGSPKVNLHVTSCFPV